MLADKILECIAIKPVSFEELLEVFKPSSVEDFRDVLKRLMINERIKINQIGSSLYYVLTEVEKEGRSGKGSPGLRMKPPAELQMPSNEAQSLSPKVNLGKYRDTVSSGAALSHEQWKKALDDGTAEWRAEQEDKKRIKFK